MFCLFGANFIDDDDDDEEVYGSVDSNGYAPPHLYLA